MPTSTEPGTPASHLAAPAGEEPRPSRMRWVMIGMAFLATVINYLDRQALSVTAPVLTDLFGMSNETYGLVVASFMLAYTVSNGISGPLIDRVGTKLGYGVCMAVWSVAGMLHAFARGPLSLGFFRFLLGAGEAGNWPAAIKVVSEWFPARERALAAGIFNSGAAIGAVVAAPTIAWLVLRFGWQASFLVVGALGFLWLAAWSLLYHTPEHVRAEARARPAHPWRLLKTRFLSSLLAAKVCIDPVWYFYIFWFPQYLDNVHGFDLKQIGMVAWIPFLTADLGNLVGGWFGGLLVRSGMGVDGARKTAVSVFALLMVTSIPAALTSSVWVAIALISVATFGYTGFSANAMAFPADVVPRNMVGSIWGLASMGSGFGGMVFSWLSGRLIDDFGYAPVFIGYGVLPLVGLAIILLFMGPLRPDPRFQAAAGAAA